jgi:hypothetical protein
MLPDEGFRPVQLGRKDGAQGKHPGYGLSAATLPRRCQYAAAPATGVCTDIAPSCWASAPPADARAPRSGQGRLVTRSRASAKKAGASFETLIAGYFAAWVDDRCERRTKDGSKDRGDISGLRHLGERLVVECKHHGGRLDVGPWLAEAEMERLNDDAIASLVVARRRGKVAAGDQVVLITLRDLVALLTGERPPEAGRDG